MARVLLIEDDVHLGDTGTIIDVADGYARNYLIPQKIAIRATKAVIKQNEVIKKASEKKLKQKQLEMKKVADKIDSTELVIRTEVGENEKLFGSITKQQVIDALKQSIDVQIDKKRIALNHPIKTTGTFLIPIKVFTGVDATLKLIVADKQEKTKKQATPTKKKKVKTASEDDQKLEEKPEEEKGKEK